MKKILFCLSIISFQYFEVLSQEIALKEVKVFPENFAHEIIEKMKKESNKNLVSFPIKCQVKATTTKNDNQIIANIYQTSLLKVNGFKLKKYKIDIINGSAKYDDAFFNSYFIGEIEKYRVLNGSINRILSFEYLDFLNDFSAYHYQISQQSDFYMIEFTSADKYEGTLKIDKKTFNILELNFNNLQPILYNYRPSEANLTKIKFVLEVVNTKASIDNASIIFTQNKNGKISFSSLESLLNYSSYKISKFDHNKANKLISVNDLTLKHEMTIKAI